jgi:hypothetical protein
MGYHHARNFYQGGVGRAVFGLIRPPFNTFAIKNQPKTLTITAASVGPKTQTPFPGIAGQALAHLICADIGRRPNRTAAAVAVDSGPWPL